jgi:hypothetical protein
MATTILKPTAPNLPLAPQQYSSQYGEQLNNVLRLYFNQLTNAVGSLIVTVNGIENEIVVLQTEVADLESLVASSQTLIWLDM